MSSLTEIPLGECSLFSSESLVEGTGLGPLVRWSRWHGLPESVSLLGCWPPETGSGRGLVLWVQALLHQLLPPPPRFPALPGLRCGLRQPSQLLWGSWLDQAPRSISELKRQRFLCSWSVCSRAMSLEVYLPCCPWWGVTCDRYPHPSSFIQDSFLPCSLEPPS